MIISKGVMQGGSVAVSVGKDGEFLFDVKKKPVRRTKKTTASKKKKEVVA
jgi:hypothetical protein